MLQYARDSFLAYRWKKSKNLFLSTVNTNTKDIRRRSFSTIQLGITQVGQNKGHRNRGALYFSLLVRRKSFVEAPRKK